METIRSVFALFLMFFTTCTYANIRVFTPTTFVFQPPGSQAMTFRCNSGMKYLAKVKYTKTESTMPHAKATRPGHGAFSPTQGQKHLTPIEPQTPPTACTVEATRWAAREIIAIMTRGPPSVVSARAHTDTDRHTHTHATHRARCRRPGWPRGACAFSGSTCLARPPRSH